MKRAEAKALGLTKYSTGKPCRKGHLADRYVTTGGCAECLQTRNLGRYQREKEKCLVDWRKWYEKNRAVHNARVKRWQAANVEKVKLDAKKWAKNNPDKIAARNVRYRLKHPDAYTARAVAGVAKRAKRTPPWLTSEDRWLMREAYRLAKLRTKMLGFVWEVDHIVPLRGEKVSGLHVPDNLQVIPKQLNRAKRNYFSL